MTKQAGFKRRVRVRMAKTGESYATSAELARDLGPFARYKANAKAMLRVIRNHRRAAYDASAAEYSSPRKKISRANFCPT